MKIIDLVEVRYVSPISFDTTYDFVVEQTRILNDEQDKYFYSVDTIFRDTMLGPERMIFVEQNNRDVFHISIEEGPNVVEIFNHINDTEIKKKFNQTTQEALNKKILSIFAQIKEMDENDS